MSKKVVGVRIEPLLPPDGLQLSRPFATRMRHVLK